MEQCFPSITLVKMLDLLFTLLLPEKSSSCYCTLVRLFQIRAPFPLFLSWMIMVFVVSPGPFLFS
jgi:hypothetical protein